jgi:hypothetical protein
LRSGRPRRVSRHTFSRYFFCKSDVLFADFAREIEVIQKLLAEAPADEPMVAAVRNAIVAANHYRAEDVPELRARMNLIVSATAFVHYTAWESYLSDALYPLVNGFDLGSPPPAGHRTKTKARY